MKNKPDAKKAVIGLSGGVDSTAAALLLKQRGYEVAGLYINVLSSGRFRTRRTKGYSDDTVEYTVDNDEKIAEGRARAEAAAEQLGIRLIYRDLSSLFDEIVINNFCAEYGRGRTPNPCIICNSEVKFRVLREVADEEGAAWIATGHYAGTWRDPETGAWHITRAANEDKDQSYMLYRLGRDVISRLLLPLSDFSDKGRVRRIAEANLLESAGAKDSQEICFIDKNDDRAAFMKRRGMEDEEGDFVDSSGKVIGRHRGIAHYTVGQRRGLGLSAGKPVFVTGIDADRNEVHIGEDEELFKKEVISADNVFADESIALSINDLCKQHRVSARIRYASKLANVRLRPAGRGLIAAEFDIPQRAPAPGQSIVFYADEWYIIGGGIIR